MGPWGILGVAAVVWMGDRVTKSLAAERVRTRAHRGLVRPSISRRLPLAPGASRTGLIAAWIGALVCAGLVLALSPALRAQPVAVAGLAAALAGAASNLLDWLRCGAIVDFIDVGFWPAFNLADAAIVTGGALALLWLV